MPPSCGEARPRSSVKRALWPEGPSEGREREGREGKRGERAREREREREGKGRGRHGAANQSVRRKAVRAKDGSDRELFRMRNPAGRVLMLALAGGGLLAMHQSTSTPGKEKEKEGEGGNAKK